MSDLKPEQAPPLTRAGRIPIESLCLAFLFLGLFLILSPTAFYKADGHHLVHRLISRNSEYPHHPFYMPVLIAFGDLVRPLGLSPFEIARLFSQVAGALAIGLCHAGFRLLRLPPWSALLATLLFAFCPAILFFSNVVEFHGPFLAATACAFLVFTLVVRSRPGSGPEILLSAGLGATTSLAAGMHASGILLPVIFLPWLLLLRYRTGSLFQDRKPAWTVLWAPFLASIIHGLGLALFVRVAQSSQFLQEGFQHPQGIEHLPEIFLQEWLLPFLPLSLIPFLFLLIPRFRLEAGLLILALSPYLLAALRLLVGDKESGAYLLPLAMPVAWLTSLALTGLRRSHELGKHALPLALSLVLISALLSLARVADFDRPASYRTYADNLRACLDREDAWVILGHPDQVDEFGAVLLMLPKLQPYLADEPAKFSATEVWKIYPELLRSKLTSGESIYITDKALQFLQMPQANKNGGGGRAFVALLRQLCELDPIRGKGLLVYRLRLK